MINKTERKHIIEYQYLHVRIHKKTYHRIPIFTCTNTQKNTKNMITAFFSNNMILFFQIFGKQQNIICLINIFILFLMNKIC
jgi:hypothetical protein